MYIYIYFKYIVHLYITCSDWVRILEVFPNMIWIYRDLVFFSFPNMTGILVNDGFLEGCLLLFRIYLSSLACWAQMWIILSMEEMANQLRLVVYPIIYKVL